MIALLAAVNFDIALNDNQFGALRQLDDGFRACPMIRDHMWGGVARWVVWGVEPGDFLLAVLRNDLMDACGRADDWNQRAIFEWAKLLHNGLPSMSFGGRAQVDAWARQSGLADDAQRAVLADRRRAALVHVG